MTILAAILFVTGLVLAGSESATFYPNLLGLGFLGLTAHIARRI